MTIVPVLTAIAAIGVAAGFEGIYRFLTKRWTLPSDKEVWAFGYWVTLCVIAGACGVIPLQAPDFDSWLPFVIIMVMHFCLSMDSDFLRRIGKTTNGDEQ